MKSLTATPTYQNLQAQIDSLEAEKAVRQERVKRFEVFMQALRRKQGELTEFDASTWASVIDRVIVKNDGGLVFRFANGLEVEK